jgi:hypothetical protein
MKLLDLKLLDSVGTSYDQTRTTLAGRVTQRTIDSKPVLGPSPTRFIDVFSDTLGTVTPAATFFASNNSRIFVLGTPTASPTALLPILCYEFNSTTGAHTYIGRVNVRLPQSPAIVHTIRALKVVDAGTTGWKIYLSAVGTVLVAGSGTLLVNKVDRADFTQVAPPTIDFATGNDQKAVYQLGRRATMNSRSMTITLGTPVKFNFTAHGFANNDQVYFTSQVGAAWTSSTFVVNTKYFVRNASANDFELSATFNGASIAAAAGPTSVVMQELNQEIDAAGSILDYDNNRLYVHVGASAQHQYFVRNTSVAPTYSTTAVDIISGTPAKINLVGHPYTENEPIQIISGTLPVGFALGTTYFVRNLTANDFELSLTAGGVSINAVTSSTGVVIGRAFGYTNSQWLHKTSILPALSGTLLLTDAERHATPTNSPINGPLLNNQSCGFFATGATGAQMYVGRLDELTAETIAWPSLTTFNYQGALNQFVVPVPFTASWADSIDRAIFLGGPAAATSFRIFVKKIENNLMSANFGDFGMDWYETTTRDSYELKTSAPPINFTNQSGWVFVLSTTIGQRGIIAIDVRSDCLFDFSYIVSKVLTLPLNSVIKSVNFFKELIATSGELDVYYRTSGFGSISGGWISLDEGQPLSIVGAAQVQFKICFKTQAIGHSSHIQVSGAEVGYEAGEELSDNWEYSFDDSSSGSPTRSAFRLKQAYASSVPLTLAFRAYDLSGVLLVDHDITNEAANFQYSTNGGTTWLALGTVPNTVGTLIRYTFASPPGVDVRPSLKDS